MTIELSEWMHQALLIGLYYLSLKHILIIICDGGSCIMIEIGLLQRSDRMLGIQFEKLFGRFDYNVTFNSEGLTILTGPNGYGKTTILKSIEAIGKEFIGIMFFLKLDFRKIIVNFENDRNIVIEKVGNRLIINDILIPIEEKDFQNSFEDLMERRPYFSKIDENTWFDRRRGARITLNDYIIDLCTRGMRNAESDVNVKQFSDELINLLKKMKQLVGKICFIKEQRLIRENKNRYDEQEVVNVIEELPTRFRELMRNIQQDYSIVANKLDSTYPNRLFETEEGIAESDYKVKMQEMASKFEMLSKYDLSTMQEPVNFIFKEEHAKALKVYFEDFEVKYQVYEDFINKADLYTDIINHRLSFKTMKISKEFGISIIDENSKHLKLTQLSSGEKQEIVLFYDLIFETKKDILLLIDEPEISLHITWQKKFMDDLLRIIDYKGFNVIVATHSPQIINNHWDRQVDLGELYGKQLNKR